MRVICIDNVRQNVPKGCENKSAPEIGEICETNGESQAYGTLYYTLVGYGTVKYISRCFALISEIDETTFERNYKKELV